MRLELFTAPYCPHCSSAREQLAAALAAWPLGDTVELVQRDVLQHLDRAVDLCIQRAPALVLDGELIQQGALDLGALHHRIRERTPCG
ncbi:redox-active disulfide protein 1 [Salinisphaera sp. PC39]|uniref:hypothetical protein n=1 Tax=Salinisphaera sp. PC39 TaxID=1304156 RepID=UPI0033422484